MAERTRNIVVGLTALAGLLGLLGMLLLFGYVPSWLESGYEIKVELPASAGLTEGSQVMLNGVGVGRILDVHLREPVTRGVEGTARINEDVRIPSNVTVRVYGPLLGGSPVLMLDVDSVEDENSITYLPIDGSATIKGSAGGSMAAEIADQLKGALDRPTTAFEEVVENFGRLSSEWEAVGNNIKQLTAPRSPDEVDAGDATANLATVLARTDQRLAELRAVLDNVQQWVGDEQFRVDIKATASQARQMTTNGNKLMDDARGQLDRLTKRYIALADDMSGTVASLNKTLELTREGDGTMSKMLTDASLYDNLSDTAQRMEQAMTELRLLIQKWKAEGLPVQF